MGARCPRQMERTAFCSVIISCGCSRILSPISIFLMSEPQVYLDLSLLGSKGSDYDDER